MYFIQGPVTSTYKKVIIISVPEKRILSNNFTNSLLHLGRGLEMILFAHSATCPENIGWSFPRVKQLWHEVDHSLPSISMVSYYNHTILKVNLQLLIPAYS
jgi:hypothetical protein